MGGAQWPYMNLTTKAGLSKTQWPAGAPASKTTSPAHYVGRFFEIPWCFSANTGSVKPAWRATGVVEEPVNVLSAASRRPWGNSSSTQCSRRPVKGIWKNNARVTPLHARSMVNPWPYSVWKIYSLHVLCARNLQATKGIEYTLWKRLHKTVRYV